MFLFSHIKLRTNISFSLKLKGLVLVVKAQLRLLFAIFVLSDALHILSAVRVVLGDFCLKVLLSVHYLFLFLHCLARLFAVLEIARRVEVVLILIIFAERLTCLVALYLHSSRGDLLGLRDFSF